MVQLLSIQGLASAWLGSCCIVAVVTWLTGRWSLRRTFDKEARSSEVIVKQKLQLADVEKRNKKLIAQNRDLTGTLRGIASLAASGIITRE